MEFEPYHFFTFVFSPIAFCTVFWVSWSSDLFFILLYFSFACRPTFDTFYFLLTYFSCYLDFVLVYEEASDAAEDKDEDFERNEKFREQFMANLRKAGLEHEEVAFQTCIYRPKVY